MAQHVDDAAFRDLAQQPSEKFCLRRWLLVPVVRHAQLRPFLRLVAMRKVKGSCSEIHGKLAVIRGIISRQPTTATFGWGAESSTTRLPVTEARSHPSRSYGA